MRAGGNNNNLFNNAVHPAQFSCCYCLCSAKCYKQKRRFVPSLSVFLLSFRSLSFVGKDDASSSATAHPKPKGSAEATATHTCTHAAPDHRSHCGCLLPINCQYCWVLLGFLFSFICLFLISAGCYCPFLKVLLLSLFSCICMTPTFSPPQPRPSLLLILLFFSILFFFTLLSTLAYVIKTHHKKQNRSALNNIKKTNY